MASAQADWIDGFYNGIFWDGIREKASYPMIVLDPA